MTDKEFKRLSRAQLIDIIYQLQLQIDDLTQQKNELNNALNDKRLRIEKAGSLAEASLEINDCFASAQRAAELYLDEIKHMREEAESEREKILEEARAEADTIISSAKKLELDSAHVFESLLRDYGQAIRETGDKS